MSVCMIQLENRWTDLDEIWYRRYATGAYPKITRFSFLHSVIPICAVGSTKTPLTVGPYNDTW